jgi:hypothetical protein
MTRVARHTVGKVSWLLALSLLGVFLPMWLFALWFQTWVVDLRCEHRGSNDVQCVSRSHSIAHESEDTVALRGVQRARAETKTYGTQRGRPKSSLRITWETAEGDVHLPVPNLATYSVDATYALADALTSFAKHPDAPPFSASVQATPFLKTIVGSLLLFFPLLVWGVGRFSVVTVDRAAGTVTVQQRFYSFTTSAVSTPLADVVDVTVVDPGRRHRRLVLRRRHAEPVTLGRVPRGRAEAEATALNRLLQG